MELVLTSPVTEPEPIRTPNVKFTRPEGLLNSNYKSIVKCNLRNTTSTSLFGIKQRIKSRQYQITSSVDTLLKLAVFAIVLAFIL